MNTDIVNGLLNFLAVSIVFLVILYISFIIFCKNFKFDKKNIELYGMFLQLKANSLIAISSITINYLFLVWATVSFNGLNIIYISFTLILSLISDVAMDNFKNIPKSLILTVSNLISIQIVYMIYDYLSSEYNSIMLFIVLLLLIIFIFMYYTYNLLRNVNNVVIDTKYIKKEKYKV